MFNIKEKFEFLEDGIDFPFYNNVPKLSNLDWLIMLFAVILIIIAICVKGIPFVDDHLALTLFILGVAPALYLCKGNYGLFFKMPRLKDIKIIVGCVIGNYLYAILIAGIFFAIGFHSTAHVNSGSAVTIASTLGQIIQLWGEEFLKIFILLLVMFAVYRYTNNRRLSLSLGIIITLLIFGVLHAGSYGGNILQILLLQGLGSIFELYAYMETKNVVVSYLVHLIVDTIPDIITVLGYG